MSNELALPEMQLPNTFLAELEADSFLPQIQLLQAQSEVVMSPPPDAPERPFAGLYWYGKNVSLGKSFEATPLAARPHALRIVNKKAHSESFDNKSPLFKDIEARSNDFAARQAGDVSRWGADILMYLPKFRKVGSIFLHSTSRSVIPEVMKLGRQLVIFSCEFIKNAKGNAWYTPRVSSPGPLPQELVDTMPSEEIKVHVQKFMGRKERQPQSLSAPGVVPGAPVVDR